MLTSDLIQSALLPALKTTFIANEAVTAGQVAVLGADGYAYYAVDPSLPGATLRPIYQAAQILCGPQSPTVVAATGTPQQTYTSSPLSGATLSNGNYVLGWIIGGAFQVGIYNVYGQQQGATVTIATGISANYSFYIVPLSGGGFAVSYIGSGASAYPYVAVYSNTGAVVAAPAAVESTFAIFGICLAPLSNGGFVVAYCNNTNWNLYFATYNASGVQQVAPTVAATGSSTLTFNSTGQALSICGLSGGGFALAYSFYNQTASTAQGYYRVFSNTGTSVVPQSAIGYAGTTYAISTVAVALPAGGFVIGIMAYISANQSSINCFNASGVLQGTSFAVTIGQYTFPYGISIIPFGTGYIASWYSGTTTGNLAQFTGAGAQVGSTNTTTIAAMGGIWATSDGGFIVLGATQFQKFTSGFVSAAPATTLSGISGAQNAGAAGEGAPSFVASLVNPVRTTAQTYVIASSGGNSMSFGIFNDNVQQYTPIGVFTANAAQGASASIQYTGQATLATGFAKPFVINANGYATPGQKMNVLGTSVIMDGIQAPAVQRAIN